MNTLVRQSLECLQRVAQFCTASPLPTPLETPAADFTLRVKYLKPLSRIARALRHTEPGMTRTFQVPKSVHSRTQLLSAARAMMRDIVPYEAVFHANGFPAAGVSQITSLVAAIEAQRRRHSERPSATGDRNPDDSRLTDARA